MSLQTKAFDNENREVALNILGEPYFCARRIFKIEVKINLAFSQGDYE